MAEGTRILMGSVREITTTTEHLIGTLTPQTFTDKTADENYTLTYLNGGPANIQVPEEAVAKVNLMSNII